MGHIGLYSLITFFVFFFVDIVNSFIAFFISCNLGLNPPSLFGWVNGFKFYQFIFEKSKQDDYKKLRKYHLFHNVINTILAVCFLVFILHDNVQKSIIKRSIGTKEALLSTSNKFRVYGAVCHGPVLLFCSSYLISFEDTKRSKWQWFGKFC